MDMFPYYTDTKEGAEIIIPIFYDFRLIVSLQPY